MQPALIAPCGMNCRFCRAYIREKAPCLGCSGDDTYKPKTRVQCKIKTCETRITNNIQHCFQCEQFPCASMNHLDKRYRTNYGMSMIENLTYIKQFGMHKFIQREQEKWTCPACGQIICVHKESCVYCGHKWR